MNADPAELAKFGELAHRWWDPQGEFRPLHQLNPLRLAWIDGLAPLAGKRVLDVGCGGGILSEAMARARRLGDGHRSLRKAAQGRRSCTCSNPALRCRLSKRSPPKTLPERSPKAFDVVTCMELLEHVPGPGEYRRRLRGAG